jgi:hypothetical protein
MSPILPIGAAIVGLFALMSPKKAKAADVTDDAADTADEAAESGAGKAGGSASGGAGSTGKKASGAAEAQRVIAEEAAAALASGDPERIEAYAKKIEAYYPDAARDARAVADAIRAARAKAKDAPSPTPKSPEVVPDEGPSKAGKKLAADVALMLQQTKPGKEDKSLLKSFSTANNLRSSNGTFDGLYGRRVGVCLATKYGIVPPRPPVSWGTTAGGYKSMAPDKQLYREAMLQMAEQDDARSDEWTAAARAVKG